MPFTASMVPEYWAMRMSILSEGQCSQKVKCCADIQYGKRNRILDAVVSWPQHHMLEKFPFIL